MLTTTRVTVEEVARVVRNVFPDARTDNLREREGRVFGRVFSEEFRGMEMEERYRRLWQAFTDEFGVEASRIGIILPFAVGEGF